MWIILKDSWVVISINSDGLKPGSEKKGNVKNAS